MFSWLRNALPLLSPQSSVPSPGTGRGGDSHGGGGERWLVTYADMITLLMVFFVVMYSVSMVNVHKLIELSQSIQKSFRFKSKITGTGMPAGPSTTETEDFQQVSKFVERTAKSAGVHSGVTQTLEQRGLTISFADSLFFDSGDVELKPRAKDLIAKIARHMIKNTYNEIRIEGHTDDTPFNRGVLASNWELSAARAAAVARFLVTSGVVGDQPQRIAVIGYGQYQPLVPNNSPLNKARNRRVDLVLLSPQFGDLEPDLTHIMQPTEIVEQPKAPVLTAQERMENMQLIVPGEEEGK